MTHDEMKAFLESYAVQREVMEAFAAGGVIQYHDTNKGWVDLTSPYIFHPNVSYRVKKEPQELFITVQGDLESAIKRGHSCVADHGSFVGGVYSNLYGATRHTNDWSSWDKPASRIFKVIEVTP